MFADADADNGEESPVPVMSDGDELGQHHPPLHPSRMSGFKAHHESEYVSVKEYLMMLPHSALTHDFIS